MKMMTKFACGVLALGCVAPAGLAMPGMGFMTAMMRAQESLPDGFHKEDDALVYRGGVDPVVLARTSQSLSKLPVSSFEMDATGGLKAFTIRGVDTSMFSAGVTVRVSSVTLAADGKLLGMTFDDEGDTGCDMTVTFEENGTIRIVCDETTYATVCDTVMSGDPITVTCECRAVPSP